MDTNYLSPVSFTISIDRLPSVQFHTQKINIPGLSAGSYDVTSPLAAIHQPGGRLTYDDLNLSFIVSENMENYLEIMDWLVGVNTPQKSEQYKRFAVGNTIASDITMTISNSHNNANMKINFVNCFPLSLSEIALDVTGTTVDYPEASVTFKYDYFTINRT